MPASLPERAHRVLSIDDKRDIESFRATFAALRAALPHARRFPLREPSERLRRRRPAPPEAMQGA